MNRLWRAPCKGGVSQWVQIPPGDGAPAGSDWSSHGGNEVAGRAGKARKRGNQDELAKPLVGVQLVQVQPGQSRSGQAGSECCHSPGDCGCEAYTASKQAVRISSEIFDYCDADAVQPAEGSIRPTVMRGGTGVAGVSSPGHAYQRTSREPRRAPCLSAVWA
jgi:hypothetical protein